MFAGIGCAHEHQCSLPQWQTEAILTAHLESSAAGSSVAWRSQTIEDVR